MNYLQVVMMYLGVIAVGGLTTFLIIPFSVPTY